MGKQDRAESELTQPGMVKEAIYAPLEGAAVMPRLREMSCETVSTLPPFAP
jgi:hypothetical protein